MAGSIPPSWGVQPRSGSISAFFLAPGPPPPIDLNDLTLAPCGGDQAAQLVHPAFFWLQWPPPRSLKNASPPPPRVAAPRGKCTPITSHLGPKLGPVKEISTQTPSFSWGSNMPSWSPKWAHGSSKPSWPGQLIRGGVVNKICFEMSHLILACDFVNCPWMTATRLFLAGRRPYFIPAKTMHPWFDC